MPEVSRLHSVVRPRMRAGFEAEMQLIQSCWSGSDASPA
jgi:hypothetical protein